eukprot:m.177179 g.177179  ORF g.177179 m.177179 type:complete len:92 (+) comp16812_c0_seq3:1835-2110(+)
MVVRLSSICAGQVRVSTVFRPVQAKHLRRLIVQASIGDDHMAAVDDLGHVITCGGNDHGQLGIGSKTDSAAPVLLKGPLDKIKVCDSVLAV